MLVVSMFFVASFHSGFEQGIVCLFLLRVGAHFPLEQLWALSGVSWVLRGRLGEAFGSFEGVLGGFWGVWGLWGRLWVLRGRLREALGCFQSISERLLGAPETP